MILGDTTSTGGNNLKLTASDTFGTITVGSRLLTTGTGTLPDPNVLDIGSTTLSVTGTAVKIGAPATAVPTVMNAATTLNVVGSGTWTMSNTANNTSFLVGVGSGNNTAGSSIAVLDMSGLANFSFTSTGTASVFGVGGQVTRPADTATLANTSNTIQAASILVGDSSQGGADNNNNVGVVSTLKLGQGTNVLDASLVRIGNDKSNGSIQFVSPTAGSLTIAGQAGGASKANIDIGRLTTASGSSTASTLLLSNTNNTSALVQAGTVRVGIQNGQTAGNATGVITFDTGTFNVDTLGLAYNLTGTSNGGATGSFTLGSDPTSTGVLNVNTAFLLGNNINSSATAPVSNATFTINGGTANINSNISVPSLNGTTNSTLNLYGGTLNMNGFAIGGTGSAHSGNGALTTATLTTSGSSATIVNLGGTGISVYSGTTAIPGLNVNGGGTLLLGNSSFGNSYSGGTTINNGSTVQLNNANATGSGSVTMSSGTLAFNTGISTFNIGGLGRQQQRGAAKHERWRYYPAHYGHRRLIQRRIKRSRRPDHSRNQWNYRTNPCLQQQQLHRPDNHHRRDFELKF